MPENYVLLEKVTVGAAGAASITFNSIPQTGYTDLVIKASMRSTAADNSISLQFNGAGINTSKILQGNGASAGSFSRSDFYETGVVNESGTTASVFSNVEIYIPNYNSSTTFKSFSIDGVTENNATTAYTTLVAGIQNSNTPISSITIANALAANSTFYLYGIAAFNVTPVIAPKATGGDVINNDGTYWYHAFRATGTFTP